MSWKMFPQVVMSALASGQCLQRMTCELGGLVQQYEGGHLLSDIADKVAPEKFRLQVSILGLDQS